MIIKYRIDKQSAATFKSIKNSILEDLNEFGNIDIVAGHSQSNLKNIELPYMGGFTHRRPNFYNEIKASIVAFKLLLKFRAFKNDNGS
jgi:hypothetical protein